MIYLTLAVVENLIVWMIQPQAVDPWGLAIGERFLMIALLWCALLDFSDGKSILIRSVIALLTLDAVSAFIQYTAWIISRGEINLTFPSFIVFIIWLVYILLREYQIEGDQYNPSNVNIFILRPRTPFETIKALIGFPAAAVCIASGGFVYAFRHRTGLFESTPYLERWGDSHIIIDTGVKHSPKITRKLVDIMGTSRWPGIKCIWSIRKVLNTIGGKYAIKNSLDYFPGIYTMRIKGR